MGLREIPSSSCLFFYPSLSCSLPASSVLCPPPGSLLSPLSPPLYPLHSATAEDNRTTNYHGGEEPPPRLPVAAPHVAHAKVVAMISEHQHCIDRLSLGVCQQVPDIVPLKHLRTAGSS